MKRQALLLFRTTLIAILFIVAVVIVNQLQAFAVLLSSFHPYAGYGFLGVSALLLLIPLFIALPFFASPKQPKLPEPENSAAVIAYSRYLTTRLPVHPSHPDGLKAQKDQRWIRTNLKLLDSEAMNVTREIATKNFFVGAFAQNTSYGTTTTLMNNIKLLWNIYTTHNKQHYLREFIHLMRAVYEQLPLADFKKEEIPEHIKPVIQASFSNTLSSLLPGGNLLTPFFMNLFLAGSTNSYITCLVGIIATRHSQATTAEERREVVQQSMFEASFMLKEIVRECNPILSLTISKAVKKAGMESLDTIPSPSTTSGVAQDIVAHLAASLKNMLKDNG